MPFVTRENRRLHYEVIDRCAPWSSAQPPIIFHHGVGSESGIWTDWITLLASRYRLITFDMCGFGKSDVPDDKFRWSMEVLSDDLLAVAGAADASRFHFIGESMGGTIGLYCAINNPDRFETLVISNGSHMGGSIENVGKWEIQIKRDGMRGWSAQFMEDRFFAGSLSDEKFRWFAEQQAAGNPKAILGALSALVGTDLRAELDSILHPVLLLHADSSPFIPATIMADLHSVLANSEMQIFAHAKHGLPFSHGPECAAIVQDFLARQLKKQTLQ